MSFVIDYFLPIGQYLSALSAPLGLQYKGGYVTRFANVDFRFKDTAIKNSTYVHGDDPVFTVSSFSMRRRSLANQPDPKLWIPRSLNENQLAVLSALIRQKA